MSDDLSRERSKSWDRTYLVSLPSPPMGHMLHKQESCSEIDEEDDESMLLVTAREPWRQCEGCLLAGGQRETDPSKPEWSTTEACKGILAGTNAEVHRLVSAAVV